MRARSDPRRWRGTPLLVGAVVLLLLLGGALNGPTGRGHAAPAAGPFSPAARSLPVSAEPTRPAVACPQPFTFQINASPTNGSAPLTVQFHAILSGGCAPYEVSWEFGDGAESTGINVTHLYNSAGAFTVDAEATDANGTSAERATTVNVTGGPGALAVHLSATVTQGPSPLAVTLWANVTGGSSDQQLAIAWTFGDDGNGSGSPIPYVFREPGNYTVVATVASSTSGTTSGEILIHVTSTTALPPPTLRLLATPSTANAPANVSVTAFVNGSGEPFRVQLCFGDGTLCASGAPPGSADGPVPFTHTFVAAGNFSIVGTLYNATGTVVAGATVGVRIDAGAPLAVRTEANASRGTAPFPVDFRAVVQGGTPPYALQWAFGDGTVGGSLPNASVSHTFTAAGTFNAWITVRDSAGHSAIGPVLVIVVAAATQPSGLLTPVVGAQTGAFVVVLLIAAVGVGVLAGRRYKDRALERRIRQEGEELVRELEGPP